MAPDPRSSPGEGGTDPGASVAGSAEKRKSPEKRAVCFTAGHKGAAFSAGVIHAWLASDRDAPAVAAGISLGALSAAAMQRCYIELGEAGRKGDEKAREPREAARWAWFRRYLDGLSGGMNVLWRAFPNPVDFFSDRPPAKDPACPLHMRDREEKANRRYYLLVKLGRWLAGIPLNFSTIAKLIVSYVRHKEGYGPMPRGLRYCLLWGRVIARLLLHVLASPQWFPEWRFKARKEAATEPEGRKAPSAARKNRSRRWPVRPLFGWGLWVTSVALVTAFLSTIGLATWLALSLVPTPELGSLLGSVPSQTLRTFGLLAWKILVVLLAACAVALIWQLALPLALTLWRNRDELWKKVDDLLAGMGRRGKARGPFIWKEIGVGGPRRGQLWAKFRPKMQPTLRGRLLDSLEIKRGLLSDYHLHRALYDLFGDEDDIGGRRKPGDDPPPTHTGNAESLGPKIQAEPTRLLIVAADLLSGAGGKPTRTQFWARERSNLIEALRTAMAPPGLFDPVMRKSTTWASRGPESASAPPQRFCLVDGAVIRNNPLPALFNYLLDNYREDSSVGGLLIGGGKADPGIYVVYNVPTERYRDPKQEPGESLNIIDAAFISLELASRRDTKLERQQTNFMAQLQKLIGAPKDQKPVLPVFAGDIAPEMDLSFKSPFNPTRKEILTQASHGCRRTLEALYQREIRVAAGPRSSIRCDVLLSRVAAERGDVLSNESPGLSEVCAKCSRRLRLHREMGEARPAYGGVSGNLPAEFPQLNRERPRIAFIASGGVFRGSFHIGVLAALHSAQLTPDLIVGASVGSLMGGAFGAISHKGKSGTDPIKMLRRLALTFLKVDEEVALTKTLKEATKRLGVRGKAINFSPRALRRIIRKGTRSDPGYAAAGAPPILIDALSHLFSLPTGKTKWIAAEFVAGHYAKATQAFWEQIKKETLPRLEIENAVMGTSLLERTARRLLGGSHGVDLTKLQPFQDEYSKTAIFSTATDMYQRRAYTLGRDFPPEASPYDFVKASLASSAFPVVFSPVREADLRPGIGRTDVLLADGGMFNNVPFFPALKVLADVQRDHRIRRSVTSLSADTAYRFLRNRFYQPDLLIAAALNEEAERGEWRVGMKSPDLITIMERANHVRNNLKINTFRLTSEKVFKQIKCLLERDKPDVNPANIGFIDETVNAGVLKIVPTDKEHLNPTYAFCRSTGLKEKRLQLSIGDGCFQSLKTLAAEQHRCGCREKSLLTQSVEGLMRGGTRMQRVCLDPEETQPAEGRCPFFTIGGDRPVCPFYTNPSAEPDLENEEELRLVGQVYQVCRGDRAHQRLAEREK